MARKSYFRHEASPDKGEESFGEAGGLQVKSPLSFQRTDGGSVDSLHDMRPTDEGEMYSVPPDPAGFIPKSSSSKGSKRSKD